MPAIGWALVSIVSVIGGAIFLPNKKIEIGSTDPAPVPTNAVPAGTLTPFNIAVIGSLLFALIWLGKKAKVI